MATTTIRVDTETHAELLELSKLAGASLIDTVRLATEALRRQRFASQVVSELDALRGEPAEWRDYLAEAEASSVGDGVG